MRFHGLLIVIVVWLAGLVVGAASGQVLSPSAGPQQMTPYVASEAKPSTYPSTSASAAYPTTSYPTTTYPSTEPASPLLADHSSSLYPSAAEPVAPLGSYGDQIVGSRPLDMGAYVERNLGGGEPWTWQVLPSGLMYKSYLAGNREPRFGSQWVHERNLGWRWDATLGARFGLLRYGTDNDFWPEGWQLDIVGAAFPRLDLDHLRDLDDVDFRAGIPLTTRQGPWEFKIGYDHFCSHLGDEYQDRFPDVQRINYVRESIISGLAVYLNPSTRCYAEAGYAFYIDGGAKPWEFQFGADLSPNEPTGIGGAPFFAVNGHLRQENDFGGNVTIQTGWQWRGQTGRLLRVGMQYFNGMSEQYQFYNRFEEQIGMGLWYDF